MTDRLPNFSSSDGRLTIPLTRPSQRQQTTTGRTHIKYIHEYVETELRHSALLGPFDQPPFTPWSQSSPMMTRPKKNSRRVIVDLSWLRAASVNTGIRRGFYQGRLRTFMDVADEVARLGPGCYIWCADLRRACRQLRTCELSTPLLGIRLDNKHYTGIAPPFGCRTSSMTCALRRTQWCT